MERERERERGRGRCHRRAAKAGGECPICCVIGGGGEEEMDYSKQSDEWLWEGWGLGGTEFMDWELRDNRE
jgi:hypothetical protein